MSLDPPAPATTVVGCTVEKDYFGICWLPTEIILNGLHHLDLDSNHSEEIFQLTLVSTSQGQQVHLSSTKIKPTSTSLTFLGQGILKFSLKAFRIQAVSSSTSFS